jgi:hypothetical protein
LQSIVPGWAGGARRQRENNRLSGNRFWMGNFYHWKGLERVCRAGGQDSAGIGTKKAGEWHSFVILAREVEWFCRSDCMVQQRESCKGAMDGLVR